MHGNHHVAPPVSPATEVWRRTGRRRATQQAASPEPSQAAQAITERMEATVREATAELYPGLWAALNEIGRSALASEVADAYMAAPPEDRGLAAIEVLEAWRRSWLVRQAPGYEEAVKRTGKTAEELGEPVYTIDKLKERIGL
jgi:hypothetical protein